jgi:hypothetical protein
MRIAGAATAPLQCLLLRSLVVPRGSVALWLALLTFTALTGTPALDRPGAHIDLAQWARLFRAPLVTTQAHAAGAERFQESQRRLLQAQIARLAPPAQGTTNIYALGVAGWADQDVFLKELDGGLAVLGGIFPLNGRTLRLVNNRATRARLPVADRTNFTAAVHAIAEVMNREQDVLLLFLTSHGGPSGFALRLPSAAISELTPREVKATLDEERIKNRLVIVSACFAGIFVRPLANDNTIVLTAADARSTSFGCAPERDWTYFGDAFFRYGLRRGRDLQAAFDNARVMIRGWELMDRAPPSNPQGYFGPALTAKLAPFFAESAGAQH